MQFTEFKQNAWKYNAAEKMEIVLIGSHGIIKNVCKNFHISQPTFRRWRERYFSNVQKIFCKNNPPKKSRHEEAPSIKLEATLRLLSMIPADILKKLKASDEYKSYCIKTIKSRCHASFKEACKSVGISSKSFHKNKDRIQRDARVCFPSLAALDFLLDHQGMDKDSLTLKMLTAGIPTTRKEAGSLYTQALSYIKKNRLRKIPAAYQFLNADDAWCMDFMSFYNDTGETRYHLKIIDDRSRMDIGNTVLEKATTSSALEFLEQAIKNTGRKPLAVKTDRGVQFKLTFSNYLKEQGIIHLKSYPDFPKFNAKIERRFKDIRLFSLANPGMDLETLIITESNIHNYIKPHKSLGGLTPCAVYWRGADPPFEHSNAKLESIQNWHPKVESDLQVIISR